ncbi:MAG TPA: GNAT family N-acetyltransferase [Pseudolysinimonas sp.]|jgi:L-2,4-diaminobutyric acid acetyltransferase
MTVAIRPVSEADAVLLRRLAVLCPPLDVHTHYTYWVLCHVSANGCFVAEDDGVPVGFTTSLRDGDAFFIWQIGILPSHRGEGLSSRLIGAVAGHAHAQGLANLQFSIDPLNATSLAAFTAFAERNHSGLTKIGRVDLHDDDLDEVEDIYRIELNPTRGSK